MKSIYCFLCLLFIFCSTSMAQKEKAIIEASIINFFDGLSEIDADKLRNYSTPDFLLLENGVVWNLDTLIAKVNPLKNLNMQRVNTFQFIKTEQINRVAWVSYHNTAAFKRNEKEQVVRWLESAVLVKVNGTWKIKLLHSTKLK